MEICGRFIVPGSRDGVHLSKKDNNLPLGKANGCGKIFRSLRTFLERMQFPVP